MSSASDTDLFLPVFSDDMLTIRFINDCIFPSLLDCFSRVKERHIPPPNDDKAKARNLSNGRVGYGGGEFNEKEKNKRTETIDYSHQDDTNLLWNQIERLNRDLGYVKDALDKLTKIEDSVGELIKTLVMQSKDADLVISSQTPGATDGNSKKIHVQLSVLTETVTKLKLRIPSPHKISSSTSDADGFVQVADEFGDYKEIPNSAVEQKLDDSSVFEDFRSTYERLDIQSKQCLLCFAVFPEHAKIKKTAMYYWWVGEGLIDPSNREYKSVDDILMEFVDMGFIQPIVKKRRMLKKSKFYTMLPLIRSMVVIMAKKADFFDFDSRGYPTAKFSKCLRSCLVRSEEDSWQTVMGTYPMSNLEKLHTLFNVNERYPDFKEEWFSNMKNINCLSLGRWHGSNKHHIEVESDEFLRGLKHMKHLKFLGFQGISRISKLPSSIGKLYNLRILDLRACHNLESLPNEICSLKELMKLDVSECYMLEYMPKGLGLLSKLEMLMGFVISDLESGSYCTLNDLANLKKLRKLGVSTSKKYFPTREELRTLQGFHELRKLTFAWRGNAISEKVDNPRESTGNTGSFESTQNQTTDDLKLPNNLEKLDLICCPLTIPPEWLKPGKLENLKSLYIRGGYLHHLSQEDKKWHVKTMRLKYLNNLTMDWRDVQQSFPDLVSMQKVDCPRLTLFPCDKNGVWLRVVSESI